MIKFFLWRKFFLMVVLLLMQNNAKSANLVDVSAKLEVNSLGKAEIVFLIRNKAPKPIKIITDELPWRHPSTILIFVSKSNGVTLEKIYPLIEMNPNDSIQIEPESELIGRLILADRFPNFDIERKKSELIVFWSYKPGYSFTLTLGDQHRIGGWFSTHINTDHEPHKTPT